jgi:putative transposase
VPWKECNQMDERLKFIARLLDGEKMAVACRQFGISRKTGYKILTRDNRIGLEGLTDRSLENPFGPKVLPMSPE